MNKLKKIGLYALLLGAINSLTLVNAEETVYFIREKRPITVEEECLTAVTCKDGVCKKSDGECLYAVEFEKKYGNKIVDEWTGSL